MNDTTVMTELKKAIQHQHEQSNTINQILLELISSEPEVDYPGISDIFQNQLTANAVIHQLMLTQLADIQTKLTRSTKYYKRSGCK